MPGKLTRMNWLPLADVLGFFKRDASTYFWIKSATTEKMISPKPMAAIIALSSTVKPLLHAQKLVFRVSKYVMFIPRTAPRNCGHVSIPDVKLEVQKGRNQARAWKE